MFKHLNRRNFSRLSVWNQFKKPSQEIIQIEEFAAWLSNLRMWQLNKKRWRKKMRYKMRFWRKMLTLIIASFAVEASNPPIPLTTKDIAKRSCTSVCTSNQKWWNNRQLFRIQYWRWWCLQLAEESSQPTKEPRRSLQRSKSCCYSRVCKIFKVTTLPSYV